MRPMLKPALSRLWRDRTTLQFGTVRRHARVVEEVNSAFASFLELIDGTRDGPALLAGGRELGLEESFCQAVLDSLAAGDLLDDAAALDSALAEFPRQQQELLGPDLASLSLVHPSPGEAAVVLQRRRGARVEVRGGGRVGTALAAALAAGGVGDVVLVDRGRVAAGDCLPAGYPASDVGRLRVTAAREVVHRSAGAPAGERAGPAAARADRPPAVVVLAPRSGGGAFADGVVAGRELLRAGIPHLHVGVVEHVGVVGPLVVPGASACAGCASLARRDEDEAWPRLLAQLADDGPGRPRSPACDSALATTVAGLAALHVELYLDGVLPPSVDGWCEISAADGMVRRIRLPGHPDCGCQWQSVPLARPGPVETVRGG